MQLKWLLTSVLATAVVVPASGPIGNYIRTGPPAARYERQPDPPGPSYVWTEGYWTPQGRHYSWVPGHWAQPPFQGAYWSHPHYDHEQQGWRLHEGHWDHEDHGNQNNRNPGNNANAHPKNNYNTKNNKNH